MAIIASPSGRTDLTKKQAEMSRARNPMADNQLNADSEYQDQQNKIADQERKGIASAEQVGQQGAAPVAGQQVQPLAPSRPDTGMRSNLQTMNARVAAKINEIMSGGGAEQLGIADSEAMQPVYNKQTERYEMPDLGDIEYDFDPLATHKKDQISQLQQDIAPFFEQTEIGGSTRLQARDFDEVLKQFADTNNDGVIDPDEQRYLDEARQAAKLLTQLEGLNPNSPEAQAIRMQLRGLDETGIASSVVEAFDLYKNLTGESGKGAEFEGDIGEQTYNIEDIINLNTEDLKEELMKSITGESGFFGGDFESALTSGKLKGDYVQQLEQDIEVRDALKQAADLWSIDTAQEFEDLNDQLATTFQTAYEDRILPTLQKQVKEAEAAGKDTAPLEAALQWFDDIYTGEGADDVGGAIAQLLGSDSGLALNERRQLADILGAAAGVPKELARNSIMTDMLDSLASKGHIEFKYTNEFGDTENKRIELTDTDRLFIMRTLDNPSISDEEKRQRVDKVINRRLDESIKNYADPEAISKYISEGKLEQGLDAFTESIVASLNTYQGSLQEEIYNDLTEDGAFSADIPEGADPRDYIDQGKVEDLKAQADKGLELITENFAKSSELIKEKITDKYSRLDMDEVKLDKLDQDIRKATEIGRQQTVDAVEEAVYDTQQISSTLQAMIQAAVAGGTTPSPDAIENMKEYAKDYVALKYWQDSAARGSPYGKQLLQRMGYGLPNSGFGLRTPDDYLADAMKFSNGKWQGVLPYDKYGNSSVRSATDRLVPFEAKELFNKSDFVKNELSRLKDVVYSGRKTIADERNKLNNYADNFYTAAEMFSEQASDLLTMSPMDVAEVALQEGRAAERDQLTGKPRSVTFTGGMTKQDIENLFSEGMISGLGYAGVATPDKVNRMPVEVQIGKLGNLTGLFDKLLGRPASSKGGAAATGTKESWRENQPYEKPVEVEGTWAGGGPVGSDTRMESDRAKQDVYERTA